MWSHVFLRHSVAVMSHLTKTETSLVMSLNIVTIVAQSVHILPACMHEDAHATLFSLQLQCQWWSGQCDVKHQFINVVYPWLTDSLLDDATNVCHYVSQISRQHCSSSSSRMCFMSHNWSATKQRLHLQSVAEISRHSVLSGDRIWQCETSSGSRHKATDQCL